MNETGINVGILLYNDKTGGLPSNYEDYVEWIAWAYSSDPDGNYTEIGNVTKKQLQFGPCSDSDFDHYWF